MFRYSRLTALFALIIVILAASCSERACSVKLNKKKFNYYNGLQYGGGKKR